MTPTQRADTRTEETSWVIEVEYPTEDKWLIVHRSFAGQSNANFDDNMIPVTLEECVEAFKTQRPRILRFLNERTSRRSATWRARNVMTNEIIMIDALTC